MTRSINCRRFSHTNMVMDGFDESLAHLKDLYGAVFLLDLPGPNWHAYLVDIGGLIVEVFAPFQFMLSSRNGPHHLGVEYEASIEEARAVVAEAGVRIMRDVGSAFHTDPADGFGCDYEFYEGSFYTNEPPWLTTMCETPEYWLKHPIGFTGFKGVTHAVADVDAASKFLTRLLGAQKIYEADRPALGARAVGMKVANDEVEFLAPTGDGPLRTEMYRSGEGVRSTIFRVADLGKARAYFEGRNIRLIDGTVPGTFAVDPADNMGILFEFTE